MTTGRINQDAILMIVIVYIKRIIYTITINYIISIKDYIILVFDNIF